MGIIDLQEHKREKEMKYERVMLRELSIHQMKERFQMFFDKGHIAIIEENGIDIGIEAFLLGAHYSKFGYYGEDEEKVKRRCRLEERNLVDTLFHFILYWGKIGASEAYHDGLYLRCEGYVQSWWHEGFRAGERRHKLKLQ